MGAMRRGTTGWLVMAVLGGCTADDPSPWFGEDDGTPFLTDDVADAFPERARLFRDAGSARLTLDGPALAPGAFVLPDDELVVVDAGDQVRVAWKNPTAQLLLWLDRPQLDDVIAWPTQGTAWRPAGDGAVGLPAGASAESVDEEGGRSLLTAEVGGWVFEVWVAVEAVDQVWTPPVEPAVDVSVDELWVRGPVLDAPGGEVLAWPAEDGVAAEMDGEAVDGWVPVRWADDGWTLHGWVFEDDVERDDVFGWASGGCGGCWHSRCGFGLGVEPNVPAGSWLRASPDGPVVGRTTRPLHRVFADDRWAEVVLHTPWGQAVTVVERPDGGEPRRR